MRILFVTDYPPEEIIGGSVRVLYEQCTRLANRNHDIHILTRKENLRKGFDIPKNLSIWKYATDNKNSYSLFFSTLKNSRILFDKLTDKFQYDLINFHQPFSATGVLHSTESHRIKKVYTCHSLSFEEYLSRNCRQNMGLKFLPYAFNAYLRKRIENYVLKNSNKILVLSKYTKAKLSETYKIANKKCVVVSGGVDLERFSPKINYINLREKLNIPLRKIVILTVRNLVQRMGLENLITAFKNVVKTAPDIHLIIGGEGSLKNRLLSLTKQLRLESYIKYVGFITNSQLPNFYRAADLFVLPTKELEGFGLVTLEAMACGLPVVGTPVGGTKEILENFDSSFLFKGTDPDSMAELILKNYHMIKHNPQRWKEISNQCRSFVERNYSWEKNLVTLEELFEETVKNHHDFS